MNLPIVFIHCNNGTFGWIKELQHLYHDDRYFSVDFNPVDYAGIARGFGFQSTQVTDPADVQTGARAGARRRTAVVHRCCHRIADHRDPAGRGMDQRGSQTRQCKGVYADDRTHPDHS